MNDEQRGKLMEDIGVALAGKPFDTMTAAEQTTVLDEVRALAGGAALTAAEATQIDDAVRRALGGDRSFGGMNDTQRAEAMDETGSTLAAIPSFQARPSEEQGAILGQISGVLADGRIDTNDGIRADQGAYTPEEVAFLNETLEKIKSGQGAG